MICSALFCVPLSVIATFCVTTLWPHTNVKPPPIIAAEDRLQLWREAAAAQSLLVLVAVLLLPWAWSVLRKKEKSPEPLILPPDNDLRQLQQQLLESFLPKKRCQSTESQRSRKPAYKFQHYNSSLRPDYEYVLPSEDLMDEIDPVEINPADWKSEEENRTSLTVVQQADRHETNSTSSVPALPPVSEMGIIKSPATVLMLDAQTETESIASAEAEVSAGEIESISSLHLEKSLSAFADKTTSITLPEEIPLPIGSKEAETQLDDGSREVMELLLPRHLRDAISANSILSEADESHMNEEQSRRRHKSLGPPRNTVKSEGTSVHESGDAPHDTTAELHFGKNTEGQKPQTVTLSLAAFPCRQQSSQIPRPSECKSLPTSPKRSETACRGQRRVTCTRCLNTRSQPASNSSIQTTGKPPTATIISTGLGPLTSPRSEGHPTPRSAAHQTAGSREPRKPVQHQHQTSRNLTSANSSQGCPRNRQCNHKK